MANITRYITADTFVNSYVDYADDNYGSSSWSLELYNGGVNDSLYALLAIDLSTIIGKTVTSATLNLYLQQFSGSPTFVFKRVTSSWVESTVTFNTKPTIDSTTYGTTSPTTTEGWKTFDLTSLVQNIAGGSTYHGIWMYSSVNEDYNWGYFHSREDANPGYISITYDGSYTVSTPVVNTTAEMLTPTKVNSKIVSTPVVNTTTEMLTPVKVNTKVVSTPVVNTTAEMLTPTLVNTKTVSPPVVNTAAEMLTPTLVNTKTVSPPVVNTAAEMLTPTVVTTSGSTFLIPTINTNIEMLTPIVSTNVLIETPVVNTTAEMLTPTLVNTKVVNTLAVNTTAEMLTPVLSIPKVVSTPAVNTTAEMLAPSISLSTNTTIEATVINTTAEMLIPSISTTVKPVAINTTCGVNNPSFISGCTLHPDPINIICRGKEPQVYTPNGVRVFKLYNYGTSTETEIGVYNWQISDRINEIPVMSCTITNLNGATLISGISIRLYLDNIKIWEGIITRIRKIEELTGYLFYGIEARGNSSLANRKLVFGSYVGKTTGYIVNDLLSKYFSALGVTAGTIETGVVMSKCIFNYVKGGDALNSIKEQTGYNWWIDKDRKLYFVNQSTYAAPVALTDSLQHSNFQQEQSMDEYRNIQFCRGGLGLTDLQQQEILQKPDGDNRTFITRFPIAKQTDMLIELRFNGGSWIPVPNSVVGVNGLDTGKQWYWSYNSNTITQDSNETALTSNDQIRITYYGLVRIFIMSENEDKISNRTAIDGYSGEYDNIESDESIEDLSQALEFADGLISTYGDIKDVISFETEVPGFQAGQLLSVEKPLFGIDSSFLISSVSLQAVDPNTITYQITALDGVAVGGWEEFFRKLYKKAQDFQIGANEAITSLKTINDLYNHSGWIAIGVSDEHFYPTTGLYPAPNMYPGGGGTLVNVYD